MTNEELEFLLNAGEGTALDFKREQYAFQGANNSDKSEWLKDILAFANSCYRKFQVKYNFPQRRPPVFARSQGFSFIIQRRY